MRPIELSPEVIALLACPRCRGKLVFNGETMTCLQEECRQLFPIIDGIPVLIDPSSSLFSFEDYQNRLANIVDDRKSRLRDFVRGIVPSISSNFRAKTNFERFERVLLQESKNPLVLVIGGGEVGHGLERLLSNPADLASLACLPEYSLMWW